MMGRTLGLIASLAALGLTWQVHTAAAEDVLRAVYAFPKPLDFSQSFLRWVEKANAAGKGVVRIDVAGGPEVIPANEQGDAVRRGVIDLQYGPATYYLGAFPEADALVGSSRTPMETRANGGLELLGQKLRERMNAHLLGHFDAGISFYIWLTREPMRTADGGVDLSGLKIRAAPIYREFFQKVGVTPVAVPVPEVYTALERGVVDGLGFPLVGVRDLSWTKFAKWRIDPSFFQTDLLTIVNLDRWNALSEAARQILQASAIAYEAESYQYFQEYQKDLDRKVREEDGVTVVELEGQAGEAYRRLAFATAWERLAAKAPDSAAALRPLFYQE